MTTLVADSDIRFITVPIHLHDERIPKSFIVLGEVRTKGDHPSVTVERVDESAEYKLSSISGVLPVYKKASLAYGNRPPEGCEGAESFLILCHLAQPVGRPHRYPFVRWHKRDGTGPSELVETGKCGHLCCPETGRHFAPTGELLLKINPMSNEYMTAVVVYELVECKRASIKPGG